MMVQLEMKLWYSSKDICAQAKLAIRKAMVWKGVMTVAVEALSSSAKFLSEGECVQASLID